MKDESQRPRTLMLPPAPYAAALFAGWWLERGRLPLPLDLGAAAWPLGGLLIALGLALFAWALYTLYRHHTTVNPYKGAAELCTGCDDGQVRPFGDANCLTEHDFVASERDAVRMAGEPMIAPISERGMTREAVFFGDGTANAWAVDAATGALGHVGWESVQGKKPRYFGLSPDASHLYAANENSHTIVVFRIDQTNGTLTPTGQVIETGSPSCIVFAT